MLFDVTLRIQADTPQAAVDDVHGWTLSPGTALQSVVGVPEAAPIGPEVADENGHLAPPGGLGPAAREGETQGGELPVEVRSENRSDDDVTP